MNLYSGLPNLATDWSFRQAVLTGARQILSHLSPVSFLYPMLSLTLDLGLVQESHVNQNKPHESQVRLHSLYLMPPSPPAEQLRFYYSTILLPVSTQSNAHRTMHSA